jgi:large subunit ribosomal protein L19
MNKMQLVESTITKKNVPDFNVGDTVKVLVRIPEGPDKVRLHPFEGVVVSKKGRGMGESFTVRKVSFGEGIERVFPVHTTSIEKIEVLRSGKVKRAKLYYLRKKIGKRATKIEEAQEATAKPE